MGSVVAHSCMMLVVGWDGTERQGAGVGFLVLCKIWLGTISVLLVVLTFFPEVFKSEYTE